MSATHLYSDTETEIVEVEKTIRGRDCLFRVEVVSNYSTWREVDEDGRGYTHTEFNGFESQIQEDEDFKNQPKPSPNQIEQIISEAETKI